MNSNIASQIIRQKATVETVFELPLTSRLYGPRMDKNNNLYVCSQIGEIIKFNENGEYSIFMSVTGQPNCIVFDSIEPPSNQEDSNRNNNNNSKTEFQEEIYYTDIANSVIYVKKPETDLEVLVKDYQGYPLKGPTSLALNIADNSLLFCDAGYFESTSLNKPEGSVFHIDIESGTVTPILLNCLAYPSDIFFDNILGIGYIAETFNNRIIKITENPQGVYHCSVFYVFSGRVGPTAITCDKDANIYVSRFEYQNKKKDEDGIISVINKEGELVGEIIVPEMSEIVGIFIPRNDNVDENAEEDINKDTTLYLTERNFNGVKKIKISDFISEINKKAEHY